MRRPGLVLLAILLAFGLWRAIALAWVSDDAFISLRYAENLVAGHGLVYNPGERVEGYTNLSWTLLLAALLALGVPELVALEAPGIVCYAWLALALAAWSRRRARETGGPFLPLAAGLVLVSNDFHVWATGGLETLLFAALLVQALLLSRRPLRGPGLPLGVGALLALLVLTRPDGLLFAAPACLSWLVPRERMPRRDAVRAALLTLAPLAATLAVLVPWKLAYYGDLLPTAFYAKSAARPYVTQGFAYVILYLAKNWFLVVAALAALVAFASGRGVLPERTRGADLVFLAGAGLFSAYLVWVGGDFMFARRLLPIAPLVFLVIEDAVALRPPPRWRPAVAAALVVGAALHYPIYTGHGLQLINHVADERSIYPRETVEARRLQGEVVGRALEGTGARVAFVGGMCMFAHWSGLPYLVEGHGLTQYNLAKRPLAERGYVGHEKTVDADWLSANDIHFVVEYDLPPVSRPPGDRTIDQIYFGGVARAHVHRYDDAVMDALRGRPGVDFVPIERAQAIVRERLASATLAEAEALYARLRHFYLDGGGERAEAWDRELRRILAAKRGAARG